MTFISVDGVLKQLRRRDVLTLGQPEFDVLSPASFAVRQVTRGVSILLPDENGGYYSRFNAISCIGQTTAARNALAALSEALRDTTAPNRIELAAGDVVVLDNWRSLGMRSAFSPRWDGRDRWMVRMYAAPSRQAGVPQSEETPRLWQ